jgi:hypothetical protein
MRRVVVRRRELGGAKGTKCSPQRTSRIGEVAASRSIGRLREEEATKLRASRWKDACSSWFVSTAEKSVFPQILWGVRRLCWVAALGAVSWHWSFAAPAEQYLAAQRGAQTGARSKARTVTSANALAAGGQFRTERMSLIAFNQSTPAHSRRQPAHQALCFCITRVVRLHEDQWPLASVSTSTLPAKER